MGVSLCSSEQRKGVLYQATADILFASENIISSHEIIREQCENVMCDPLYNVPSNIAYAKIVLDDYQQMISQVQVMLRDYCAAVKQTVDFLHQQP